VLGGVLGFFWLGSFENALPYVLVLAASSFIYIALADLVPDMQRRRMMGESALQVALLFAGIALVAIIGAQLHTH
jgi:zinc and cadmium transporter